MPTNFTVEFITMHLESLRHGGKEAIALFMELSRHIHQHGTEDGLLHWITIAAPALPEKERNEILVMLMHSHLNLDSDVHAELHLDVSGDTLH